MYEDDDPTDNHCAFLLDFLENDRFIVLGAILVVIIEKK